MLLRCSHHSLTAGTRRDPACEVMREPDDNDTSGELGSAFSESLVGESVFMTAKLEMLIESASWLPLVSVVSE